MKPLLNKIFKKVFNEQENLQYFFAPGRVNLIGEHTDYNGGLVFPCALSVGTYVAVREREDHIIRMYSDNFPDMGVVTISLNDLEKNEEHDWANYPKGVIHTMKKHGYHGSKGFDAIFYGNIPNGAGLSSSASIELVTVESALIFSPRAWVRVVARKDVVPSSGSTLFMARKDSTVPSITSPFAAPWMCMSIKPGVTYTGASNSRYSVTSSFTKLLLFPKFLIRLLSTSIKGS